MKGYNMEKRILETVEHNTVQLGRIAFALEEILRLVKEDQEQYKKKPKSKIEESLIKQNYK
jgi:hypothetical protein